MDENILARWRKRTFLYHLSIERRAVFSKNILVKMLRNPAQIPIELVSRSIREKTPFRQNIGCESVLGRQLTESDKSMKYIQSFQYMILYTTVAYLDRL